MMLMDYMTPFLRHIMKKPRKVGSQMIMLKNKKLRAAKYINGSNHRVCSYQVEENGPVYLLDSLKSSRTLNANVSLQISQMYYSNTDNLTVFIPDVQRQQNAHDCAVYAITFITEFICSNFNISISNTHFLTSSMRTLLTLH